MPRIKTMLTQAPFLLAMFGCAVRPAQTQELRLPDNTTVLGVMYSRDGESIISFSAASTVFVRVWNAQTGELESERELETDVHGNRFLLMERPRFDGDGKLAVACPRSIAQIWNTETGKAREIALPENIGVSHMDISFDGRLVALVHGRRNFTGIREDIPVSVWDVNTGVQLHRWQHEGALDPKDVAFSRDGKLVCTASQENGVMVWDVESGELLRHIENDNTGKEHPAGDLRAPNQVVSVAIRPGNRVLAAGDMFGVKLWDLETGRLVHSIDAPSRSGPLSLEFSPCGNFLARTGGEVLVWNANDGRLASRIESGALCVAFSPDSQRLALGISDREQALSVWTLEGK